MYKSILILAAIFSSSSLMAADGAYYSTKLKKCIEFEPKDGLIPAYKTLKLCQKAHPIEEVKRVNTVTQKGKKGKK